MNNDKSIPPLPQGVQILAGAVVAAYNQAATRVPLTLAEIMVALGAATVFILAEAAAQSGHDPQKVIDDFRAQLKLPEE